MMEPTRMPLPVVTIEKHPRTLSNSAECRENVERNVVRNVMETTGSKCFGAVTYLARS